MIQFTEFKSILDLIKAFPDEQACIDHLESLRWSEEITSPFQSDSKVYKCRGNKYKCKSTGKYFNVRTGTIFDNTKLPLQKWFMALYIFSSHKKGISSHQLAKDISITQKSAWFVLHRLRHAFDHPGFKKIVGGITEIDETFIGGNDDNKHESAKNNRLASGNPIGKKPVLGMMNRDGNVIAQVIDDVKNININPIIRQFVPSKTIIMTDNRTGYKSLNKEYYHFSVNHSAREFVNGLTHTNGIENFWSMLKRGIDGIYHSISVKHLQSYVNEYALRHNTRKLETQNRFDLILANITNKRLTYDMLINKND